MKVLQWNVKIVQIGIWIDISREKEKVSYWERVMEIVIL